MATSEIVVDGIGSVVVFRRKGLKNLRITIAPDGHVRLNIPWYVPKSAGMRYLHSKKDWIKKHKPAATGRDWADGQSLFGNYILKIHYSEKRHTTGKLSGEAFHVFVPRDLTPAKVQTALTAQIKKFLKQEGEKLLIPLTLRLAAENGFKINKVRLKHLKSRWGSCSHEKNITLNLSLLKLPDELVEYVIFHELAHTRQLNHGKAFWQEVETMVPDYKSLKKSLRSYNQAGIL